MCSCNKKKKAQPLVQSSTAKASYSSAPFAENPDFVLVTYHGARYTHSIVSPTKIMWEQYQMRSYGRGAFGLELYVHKNDVVARPDLFVVIKPEKVSKSKKVE